MDETDCNLKLARCYDRVPKGVCLVDKCVPRNTPPHCSLVGAIPGVNHLKTFDRWTFAEFTEVHEIETDFKEKVEGRFNGMFQTMGTLLLA